MIRNGKIEVSLVGVGKFFGVLLGATVMLTALTALAVMPFGAYGTDRQVKATFGDHMVIVDVQETPGFVSNVLVDAKLTRYVRTSACAWYSYDSGRQVNPCDELERAYQGFLIRQKADDVLTASRQTAKPDVSTAVQEPKY